MKEIQLPDPRRDLAPPTLEDEIREAIYEASNFNRPTRIMWGQRSAYLIDQFTYERLVAVVEAGGRT